MSRKRKKDDVYPDDWDMEEETQDPNAVPPPFEFVAETQDPDAVPPPFEFVAETQDPDGDEQKTDDEAGIEDVPDVAELQGLLQPSSVSHPSASIYQLKEITSDTYSSVICKLAGICRVPDLVQEIKRVCVVMQQVRLEAWHLANLHVLRSIREGEAVPQLNDQMMFYRCCAATLGNIESRDRGSDQSEYPSFRRSCMQYWAGREQLPSYQSECLHRATALLNQTAKLMSINALNMLALQFRRRLHQYVRFRYAPKGKIQLKYKDTLSLVDSCYRVKTEPELNADGSPTGNTVKLWSVWAETDDPVEKELRELAIVPWQGQIRDNSAHFLRKVYDMLSWMEAFVLKHPKTKGARLYSMLPVPKTYEAGYVKINSSTLFGLFARIVKDPKVEAFLEEELNIVSARRQTSNSQRRFTEKTFQTHRHEILRKVFDVEKFETTNRKFADEIKTNSVTGLH